MGLLRIQLESVGVTFVVRIRIFPTTVGEVIFTVAGWAIAEADCTNANAMSYYTTTLDVVLQRTRVRLS